MGAYSETGLLFVPFDTVKLSPVRSHGSAGSLHLFTRSPSKNPPHYPDSDMRIGTEAAMCVLMYDPLVV